MNAAKRSFAIAAGFLNNQMADIPNSEGFKLQVYPTTGPAINTAVLRDKSTGCHLLALPDDVKYSDLTGWRKLAGK